MTKKWDKWQKLNMPLGEIIRNEMRTMYVKFHEFSMHKNEDMNLSLYSFSEFCRMGQQESLIFEYLIIKILFKGFQRNLFYIFVSYILFSMNFQT
jgi:hypothetical protein